MRVCYGFFVLAVAAVPGVAADDGLRQAIEKHVYRFEASGPGTYRAENLRQQLAVEFDAHSAKLEHPEGSVGFQLTGYGYGKHPRIPSEAKPDGSANRLEYRRGDLTEWYVNTAAGLEQGFTLAQRPGAAGAGEPLVITLAVEGALRPLLAPGGDAVLLQAGDRTILRYGGLRSWDARGHAVASRLEVREREVRLVMEDRDAQYPLVVDPTWTLEAELMAPDQAFGDLFGTSVSLSGATTPGDTVLVGSPGHRTSGHFFQGAAYVFVRTGTTWNFQQELTAADGSSDDAFGSSVSLSGTTAVIGAPGHNSFQGAAYVFVRSGTTWSLQQELMAADGMSNDQFGNSVSVDGDTALIGGPSHTVGLNIAQGAAYVFVRGGTTWSPQQELTAADGSSNDNFGASVAVSGTTAVIGAPGKNNVIGAAYVFVRSGTTWSFQQELTAPDGAVNDDFGISVAVDEKTSTAVVGAERHTVGMNAEQGAAYVFVRTGTVWNLPQELMSSDGSAFDHFGFSVSVNGDIVAVGAPRHAASQGEAYVFVRNGTTWTQQAILLDPDGGPESMFGTSVSVSGNRVAVGAPAFGGESPTPKALGPAPRGGSPAVSATYIFVGPALPVPALMKSFTPPTIYAGTTSTLTFNLSNSSTAMLSGVMFTDPLPSGVVPATPNNLNNMCGGTASVMGSLISLSGVTLAGGASCTLSLTVTASTQGSYPNMTSTVTSTDGGTGMPASATLTVIVLPVITKVFGAATVPAGGSTSLTFTVTNPAGNPIALTSVGFTDSLPSGIVVASPSNLSTNCGGMPSAPLGGGVVMLAGVTLAPGVTCMLSLNVTGTTPGARTNSVTVVSDQGVGNTATAPITVVGPPVLNKVFNAASILAGQTTTLTFMVSNTNASVALTQVGFTDTLPSGLIIATPNGLTGTCGGGMITVGSNTVTLSLATLAPSTTCTFSVNVTGAVGTYLNTTGLVTSANGGPGPAASAPLAIGIPPALDAFQIRYASNLNIGDSFVDITNTGASNGNLCVNVYTFDQSEELLSCCACLVTPNGLASLSVKQSLTSNNLTPEIPNSVVIKLLATAGGSSAGSCNAATPTTATLASGMRAWGTTLHATPTTPVRYGITETPFLTSDLSPGELNHLTTFCGFIQSNASGFGICKGCSVGGLGATVQR